MAHTSSNVEVERFSTTTVALISAVNIINLCLDLTNRMVF